MKDYETDDTKRLQTLPGIGRIAAFTIIAEMGDPKRFKTSAQFASYGGVSPVTFASGSSSFTKLNRRGSRRLNCIFGGIWLEDF
jgi:transposase